MCARVRSCVLILSLTLFKRVRVCFCLCVYAHSHFLQTCARAYVRVCRPRTLLLLPAEPHLVTEQDLTGLELLPYMAMPNHAYILSSPPSPQVYSSMLTRSGKPPLYLHCFLRYAEAPRAAVGLGGDGVVHVPECVMVASEGKFHGTLLSVVAAFCSGLAASDTVRVLVCVCVCVLVYVCMHACI